MVKATLDRLNAFGAIASVSDAVIALHKARDAKVLAAFSSIFNDLSLEELVTAQAVLDELFPKPPPPQSMTQPPAAPVSYSATKKGKR